MEESKYYLQIDLIKAAAIVSVILIHTYTLTYILDSINSTFLQSQTIKFTALSFIGLILIFTAYQAVPMFFVIMGRNMGTSFERRGYNTLREIFSLNYFKSRIMRIGIPFILIFFISILIAALLNKEIYIGLLTLIGYLPITGPGNYFISIVFEFALVFPFLFVLYKRNVYLMLFVCFFINIVFELLAMNTPVLNKDSYLYPACILRYLFVIGLGLWTVNVKLENIIKNKVITIGSTIGMLYLTILVFLKWNLPFSQISWVHGDIMASFYVVFLMAIGMKYLPSFSKNKVINFFGLIGKSSYHIFLVQTLFFGLGLSFLNGKYPFVLALTLNIISTVLIGLVLFYIDVELINQYISRVNMQDMPKRMYRAITVKWNK